VRPEMFQLSVVMLLSLLLAMSSLLLTFMS
jgi:hypothetical protein